MTMPLQIISPIVMIYLSLFSMPASLAQKKKSLDGMKYAAVKFIDRNEDSLIAWTDSIWRFAEPSTQELQSSKLLINILQREGFTIQQNLSGFGSIFIASYGVAKPIIGLFGEYDADPKASNKVVPKHEELVPGGYGHGGGHNLLAVGSLGAALAIKNLIKLGKLKCTIRYYGTTAEGSLGTKTLLARDGYFNDLDLSLYWHPSPGTWASTAPWDALIDFDITFSGKKVNVIRDLPDEFNPLSALESLLSEMKSIRSEMSPGKKINYSLMHWKGDTNVIPDTIKLAVRIQCTRQKDALTMFDKINSIVKDISQRNKVFGKIDVRREVHQFLPNVTAMQLVHQNMELLGPMSYTEQEVQYAKEMQRFLNKPDDGIVDKVAAFSDQSKREPLYGYASDIGDASWIAPEIYFTVRTLPPSIPMHHWAGTAFSGYSIGHKGMVHAAKILSLTIIDYLENKPLQQAIRIEFEQNKNGYTYRSLLNPGR
jgi:aminobenzoyl-glutamate utilization protein B